MRNIRKILAPLGVLALLSATTAFANEKFPGEDAAKGLNLPAVVAKVNGVDVPADHVKFEFNRIIRDIPGKPDPSQLIQLMQSIIDREVVRELVFQQAKKEKVKVDLMEIDRMVAAIKKGYASEQEWQAALSARGVDEAKIRDSIRVDLMARELLEEQVRGKVTITDAQVENFYQENKAKFQRPEAFRAS
ncbi:MAG: SurA N-terminal domain-containing protein, partial [Nitrospinaceae bacterium]